MSPRSIVSLTGSRADYGLMRSVHRTIAAAPDLKLTLIVTGMHLLPEFRVGLDEIVSDGFPMKHVGMVLAEDSGKAMAQTLGIGLVGIAAALDELKPDVLLLQGDRGEMLAGAIAAAHMNIPIVHMSGGDRSGTIDDSVRATISKLAHIHLTTCADSTSNLIAMGEIRPRIMTVGEPALDIIHEEAEAGAELIGDLANDASKPLILATQHPVTTESESAAEQMLTTLRALDRLQWPTIFTYPNSDSGGRRMAAVLESWRDRSWLTILPTLGTRRFLALLKRASVIVGNSSSGILEAPSFQVPAVNIGARQYGRQRAANVIDVDHDETSIESAIRHVVTDTEYRRELGRCVNPYGDGQASRRTVHVLRHLEITPRLIAKWLSPPASFLAVPCDEV
jgi:UDP-N-acetylglucosamine 2-epimerase (non-hydrolysing)/GDP/UDP-N,N'-diacetylbacillosamine 2-epimerase (hydrolysing)